METAVSFPSWGSVNRERTWDDSYKLFPNLVISHFHAGMDIGLQVRGGWGWGGLLGVSTFHWRVRHASVCTVTVLNWRDEAIKITVVTIIGYLKVKRKAGCPGRRLSPTVLYVYILLNCKSKYIMKERVSLCKVSLLNAQTERISAERIWFVFLEQNIICLWQLNNYITSIFRSAVCYSLREDPGHG